MSRYFSGGKRAREANRDLKKRQKEARLRRNRELRARGIDSDVMEAPAESRFGELVDVVIVPNRADSRRRRRSAAQGAHTAQTRRALRCSARPGRYTP